MIVYLLITEDKNGNNAIQGAFSDKAKAEEHMIALGDDPEEYCSYEIAAFKVGEPDRHYL